MPKTLILCGAAVHSAAIDRLELIEHALVRVENGQITDLHRFSSTAELREAADAAAASSQSPGNDPAPTVRHLPRNRFLIPGLVDTHNHAPQWTQRGLGQSMHILDWLSAVTFPNEARFADPAHARRVYPALVAGMLRQGVTTAAYYGSIHPGATEVLVDSVLAAGQRALVGKCNMDRNAPQWYLDAGWEESVAETRRCIEYVRRRAAEHEAKGGGKAMVRYVVTPRFAIACGDSLLEGLGELVKEYDSKDDMSGADDGGSQALAIQTHFNEARQEMTLTRTLFPAFADEGDLYDHFGLLTSRTILAHCCYMSPREVRLLRERECGVAHCPVANMTVGGGFMAAPIRRMLRDGLGKIGLGTDSGGGYSSGVLDALRLALVASYKREADGYADNQNDVAESPNTSRVVDEIERGLSLDEAFYMATLGGAKVCGLGDRVGSFEVGKDFDAVEVDVTAAEGIMTPFEEGDSLRTIFDKFVMTADDRNMARVYVCGKVVGGTEARRDISMAGDV